MSPLFLLALLVDGRTVQIDAPAFVAPRAEALQALSLIRRAASQTPAGSRGKSAPRMQFGGGEPERKGLTRDNEPDEFFSTNMDDMSDEEKLKSPVVIGGLALLILPFIVGAIALQFYK